MATSQYSPPAAARGASWETLHKLRPAKVNTALRRRWFERRMTRLPLEPRTDLVDLGTGYGGWTVPQGLLEPSWTCYSIGAGADISFDLELIGRYGLAVRSVDPVEDYVERAIATAAGESRFAARRAAIAVSDGPVRMQVTHVPGSRSLSAARLYDTRDFVEVPGRSLSSLMAELGDSKIDLLKLDVEGAEYGLLPELDLAALGVRVFCTQLHHNRPVREAKRLVARLAESGLRPVACRPVVKLTFVRDGL